MNEDGEVVAKRKDGKDGPWNKLGDGPSNQVHSRSIKKSENVFTNLTVSVGQGSMEEREEMPEQKREAVELLASSNVVGGSYVPPHMRGQVIPFRKSYVNFNGSSEREGNSKTQN